MYSALIVQGWVSYSRAAARCCAYNSDLAHCSPPQPLCSPPPPPPITTPTCSLARLTAAYSNLIQMFNPLFIIQCPLPYFTQTSPAAVDTPSLHFVSDSPTHVWATYFTRGHVVSNISCTLFSLQHPLSSHTHTPHTPQPLLLLPPAPSPPHSLHQSHCCPTRCPTSTAKGCNPFCWKINPARSAISQSLFTFPPSDFRTRTSAHSRHPGWLTSFLP